MGESCIYTKDVEAGLVYDIIDYYVHLNVHLNEGDFVDSTSSLVRFDNILKWRLIATQSTKAVDSRSRGVQNHWVAPRLTQPSILPRLIK